MATSDFDDDLLQTFPIVLNTTGYVPQTPGALHDDLIDDVLSTNPGYSANLPGSLVEDISSTDVFAMLQLDSSIAETIDSVTPFGANPFLLTQLGNVYGIIPQLATNTSAFVVFSGPPGYVIAKGFIVSDGVYQYQCIDGGVIGIGGTSLQIFAQALVTGSWAVPANSVNQWITAVPDAIVNAGFSVTNPQVGTPSTVAESEAQFRTRTLQAGYAPSSGMTSYLKTLLQNIPGVQARLVSMRQFNLPSGGTAWEVISGGGDPYQTAYAIFTGLFDILDTSGSVMFIDGISNANPGVVTTPLNHGYATGQVIQIYDASAQFGSTQQPMLFVNNVNLTITVIDEKTFSIGIDTTFAGTFVANGGCYCEPNFRNITVSLLDYPDTYNITYVNPPTQTVAIQLTWNTLQTNYVDPTIVAQLGNAALVAYINAIPVGQAINLFELQTYFQQSVANIIPPQLLTQMTFSVSINGIGVAPIAGTGIIAGDPESYFETNSTLISVTQAMPP